MNKALLRLFVVGLLMSGSTLSYAFPFTIAPKIPLPTQLIEGQTTIALYTITNNTRAYRPNNYVKYLPPNVEQIKTDPNIPDLCGATFALEANDGVPGRKSSCTLALQIKGEVDANDPNPHHHLFVCFPGGTTCAGTLNSLNVSVLACPSPTNTLVAVGAYTDAADISFPGIAISKNRGTSWQVTSLDISLGFTEAFLQGVNCTCNRCVAVGASQDADTHQLPLIAISENAGKSWLEHTLPATTLPPGFSDGVWKNVYCLGQDCIAVGNYTLAKNKNLRMAIATSSDGGESWTQQAFPIPPHTGPAKLITGGLNAISCAGKLCIAAGFYQDNNTTPAPNNHPTVIISTDEGKNWVQKVLPLPPNIPSGSFNGISCIGMHCVAVGFYDVNLGVAVTQDGGKHWTTTPLLPPDSNLTAGNLNAVSCRNSFCMATGSYQRASTSQAVEVVAISYNGGLTWAQQTTPFIPKVEGTGVYCSSAGLCAVSGFFNTFPVTTNPFGTVAITTDDGSTWNSPIKQKVPLVPGIQSAKLFGISGTAGT